MNMKIPDVNDDVVFEKYNLKELKCISKYYKLKTSFRKETLISNIKELFLRKQKVVIIQRFFRGWIVRSWIKSHGPAFKTRDCVNDVDFLTMETMNEIDSIHFFSYCDKEYSYGFNILSIYNLIKTTNPSNPYNRKIIDLSIISQMNQMLRLSKIIGIDICLKIDNEVDIGKNIDFRILDLFQTMNGLGNYSDHLWFTTLQRDSLVRFIRELNDIWFYRSQISRETRYKICPRGNPFRHIHIHRLDENITQLKEKILKIMEEMVYSGVDVDSKILGCYYILGSLTLVNNNAAMAMPWLFETFF